MERIVAALGGSDAPAALYNLAALLRIPMSLKELGMPADGIQKTVQAVLREPYWNPRGLRADRLRAHLTRAYEGAPPRIE
jgi:alcohol dehydrogenase class IV